MVKINERRAESEPGKKERVPSSGQLTQLIRLHGRGFAPVHRYSCPEMWLYWQDYIRPCSLMQLCSIGADKTSATSLSLSIYNLLLYATDSRNEWSSFSTSHLRTSSYSSWNSLHSNCAIDAAAYSRNAWASFSTCCISSHLPPATTPVGAHSSQIVL